MLKKNSNLPGGQALVRVKILGLLSLLIILSAFQLSHPKCRYTGSLNNLLDYYSLYDQFILPGSNESSVFIQVNVISLHPSQIQHRLQALFFVKFDDTSSYF